jgi:hypothetical protein
MPDGSSSSQIVYAPAKRKNVGALIMLAGPAGSGKTYSALKLAKGLAGPEGKIAFCDSENERGLYYANEFEFNLYYSLSEPFRPSRFEAAAVAAQKQGATVWICDSFSAEHSGPGGLLDFHESEMQRMAGDDFNKRERMKAAAWIKPKMEHKHMLQRFYQLNMHVILCCQAEKKTAVRLIMDGPKKGKTEFVDLGYQPVVGGDIPYAMTMSFMFATEAPGVPIVIKPLLRDLIPVIDLNKPMDEEQGVRIAAWARGEAVAAPTTENTSSGNTRSRKPPPTEAEIEAGAQALADRFRQTTDRASHIALGKEPAVVKQREWLTANRREMFDRIVGPAMSESWERTKPAEERPTDLEPGEEPVTQPNLEPAEEPATQPNLELPQE